MAVRLCSPVCKLLLTLLPAALGVTALAQAAPGATGSGPAPSRLELYGGYGYFYPFNSDINNQPYETVSGGGVGSVSGFYNRYVGLQVEGSAFPSRTNDNNCVYTAQAGPVLRVPRGRFVPFFHALGGAAKVGGPRAQTCSVWGWGVTSGFGLDYILPGFHNHIALRPAQGDFQYSQIDNGPSLPGGNAGGLGQIWNFRLSAGLNLRFGRMGPYGGSSISPTMTCSVDPAEGFPGDPLQISSRVTDLQPASSTRYLWTSSGGQIEGIEPSEPIETQGLAPGIYSVHGHLVQGVSERQVATCTASFTVHAFAPPTLTCAADRAAIHAGDPVLITAHGISPQNRPLTYTYSTSAGQISAHGQTTNLNTTGASPGLLTVDCAVTDDLGHKAHALTSVVIATPAPALPVASQAAPLCSLSFERDTRRPDRVDTAARACLDEIALKLAQDTSTHLVLIGEHVPGETDHDAAARTLNAAEYLVREKGVDRNRLNLRIAAEPIKQVRTLLVPAGASIDEMAGEPFDPAAESLSNQPASRSRAKHRVRRAPAKSPVRRRATLKDFQN